MRPLWRDMIFFFSLSVPSDSLILRHNGAAPEQSVCCVWKHRRASQSPLTRRWGSSCWNGGIIRKKKRKGKERESNYTHNWFARSDTLRQERCDLAALKPLQCLPGESCMHDSWDLVPWWFLSQLLQSLCVFFFPHSNFPQEAAFPLFVGGDDDDDDDGVQLAARDWVDVEITRSL